MTQDAVGRTKTWNPRYVVFATVHGRTPDEQAAHDRIRWPGGCMTGFQLWIAQSLRAFQDRYKRTNPEYFIDRRVCDAAAWDTFLRDHGVRLPDDPVPADPDKIQHVQSDYERKL